MANERSADSYNPVYQPLEPGQTRRVWNKMKDGFRYFELEVVNIGSKVVGETFADDERYIALSYTWGHPDTIGATIKGLDGTFYPIYITKSLLVFCEYALRAFGQVLPMWIDQLSIDQTNHDEKISQIKMMRQIYEASAHVVIWLGPPDADSRIAMQRISFLRQEFTKMTAEKLPWEADDGFIIPDYLSRLTGPSTEENYQEWRAMLKLIDRAWFSRVWIIQEATSQRVFSDRTVVLCGEDKTYFDDFMRFWRVIANIQPWHWNSEMTQWLFKSGHLDHSSFNVIGSFWMHRQMYTWFPILDLLRDVRQFKATDPRDKVIPIGSFATDVKSAKNQLELSYHKTTEQTYVDLIVWYIQEHGNLDFLGSLEKEISGEDMLAQLPDWVPDWRVEISRRGYTYYQQANVIKHRTPMYHACGGERLNSLVINGDIGHTGTLQALSLSGLFLTTVKPWIPRVEYCDKFSATMAQNECPLNHTPLIDVFSRTMCVDMGKTLIDRRPAVLRGAYHKPYQKCAYGNESCFLNFSGIPGLVMNPESVHIGRQFFLLQPSIGDDVGAMGLGEQGLRENDELWALEGGKMLYLLRPWSLPDTHLIRNLDVTGTPNSPEARKYMAGSTMYQLVGECFVLGLMDGEILDMLGDQPKRTRPSCLNHMDHDFRKIDILHPKSLSLNKHHPYGDANQDMEVYLSNARLGLARDLTNITEHRDKRMYWTPEVVARWDEEEKVPGEKPSDKYAPFLTCDVGEG